MPDAHTVTYSRPETVRCWADGRWGECGRRATTGLGLCEAHYEAIREETRC